MISIHRTQHEDIRKGNNLVAASSDLELTINSDPRFPTRLGNSVSRGTMPDLCFTKNASARWSNLQENLGSDHSIIEIMLDIPHTPPKRYKYVDWDLFREIRGNDETVYDNLGDLFAQVLKDIAKASKVITTERNVPCMDSRLAHLLEAKRFLLERWKTQRLNCRLRKKVSEINKPIEKHSNESNNYGGMFV